MAVRLLARNVSELCIGKPPLRSLPISATAAEALAALRRSGERYISVWSFDYRESDKGCLCVGRICMVDLICFLCREMNLGNPNEALQVAVSDVMVEGGGIVRHLESNSSVLEAIDYILEGAQQLLIPTASKTTINSTKKHLKSLDFCWLTQEDIVRFLLDSISTFSPLPTLSLESLGIIDANITTVHFNDPLSPSITRNRNLARQIPIAIIDDENKLIGEISPYKLACCNEAFAVAMAMTTLSARDFMAFIDYNGYEDCVHQTHSDLSLSSSTSCSSDEEFGPYRGCGFGRKSEAIVCYPWSSLAAVMVQALAYRVNYVWVINEDYSVAGIVTFMGILKAFRSSVDEKLL